MLVDYSTSRPTIAPLKAAGVTAVGRYIGWDSVPGYTSIGKNLTTAEAHLILSANISIFLSFEYAANAAVNGASQGDADGTLAISQLLTLGAPADMAVYFVVDFDIPDYAPSLPDTAANARAKLGPVGDYFAAIAAIKPMYQIGIYGGYYAVKRILDAGLASKAWQATAWSGGMLDYRAVLYQTLAVSPIPGGDVDIREHTSTVADFGQWPRPSIKPSVPQGDAVGYPMILNSLEEVAYVLPIPEGKTKVVLYADSLGQPGPVIRIGFGPAWSKAEMKPTWDIPAVVTIPPTGQRITVSRVDAGRVPVTLDFA